jgi:outer membrane protein assembly factor BamB
MFRGFMYSSPTAIGVLLVLTAGAVVAVREIEWSGDSGYIFRFRWEPTQEERLAAFNSSGSALGTSLALDPGAPRATDFLGPRRDGIVPGPALARSWSAGQPKELWRRPVGGGYASFVTAGGLAVTLEQRGDEETVVAYDLQTGAERWTRSYPGHFKESMGGNGPRATPTIVVQDVIALGATGTLAVLDLATGREKWHTNILSNAEAQNIDFGMSGAPLVLDGRVIVHPGGKGNSVVAYDRHTGKKLWGGGDQRAGYATPRISAGYDAGAVLLHVQEESGQWSATEVWKNKRLKCKFSSPIYFNDHIYGLDDGILVCLDAVTGERKWKGGRYGHGQLLLRQDLLVILSESGEVVLVAADPAAHRELARRPMLPGGKTWNAPTLAGNLLLIRNHFEAVCLELPLAPVPIP